MPDTEIELNPIDFLAVGTVGPKGRRTFHIQAGKGRQFITLTLEKEQTQALGEAIGELLDDLLNRYPEGAEDDDILSEIDTALRDPVDPMFRVSQIGLGYDETRNMVVIVAQELVIMDDDEDPDDAQPRIVRFWGTRDQFRAMSKNAIQLVKKGRADPKGNGRVIYYWT